MKNILQILLVLNMFLLNSCLENGQLKEADLGKTKLFIINQGDDKAYDDLRNYYLTNKDASSIMPYSMIMAYKYNHAFACFDLFDITIRINNNGDYGSDLIKNLDLDSRKFALYNLIKSADLGDVTAKKYLAKYYRDGIYLPKNIEIAIKLEKEIN